MLRLFRNNSPFTVIILFIFALVVKFQAVLYPVMPMPVARHFMYNYILRALYVVFRHGAFAYTMLAIVILFIQSLYLKSISIRHKLFPRYTYVPAFVYLLLTSIYPPFNCFNETLLINWLLLGAVDIMFGFTQTTQPRKLIFNASFLLSMAALFQFTMLAYFFLLLVGMVMFRSFNLGEWSVAAMGYATPPYFLACILFLADRSHLYTEWPHIGFSLSATRILAILPDRYAGRDTYSIGKWYICYATQCSYEQYIYTARLDSHFFLSYYIHICSNSYR